MAKGFFLLRMLGCATSLIDLASPLRRDECVRRLRVHVDGKWTPFGTRPVIGEIGETSFTLRVRIGYRNSFRTVSRGTFAEESRQTRIGCRIGIDPFVRVFMLAWLAIVAIVGCAVAASAVGQLLHGRAGAGSPLAPILAPALMLCFGLALVKGGRWLARGEQQVLVDFLARRLDARVISTNVPVRESYESKIAARP